MKLMNLKLPSFFLKKSVGGIFISDHKACPCYISYDFATKVNLINSVKVTDPKSAESQQQINRLNKMDKLLVYVHGDQETLQCFYRSSSKDQSRVFIANQWWKLISGVGRVVYFHTCFGAQILRSQALAESIKSWVSYTDEIAAILGRNPDVERVNVGFLRRVATAFKSINNIDSLKRGIRLAYHAINADISGNNQFPGFTFYIAAVGRNVHLLTSSHDSATSSPLKI